jgi:hypothetical protein
VSSDLGPKANAPVRPDARRGSWSVDMSIGQRRGFAAVIPPLLGSDSQAYAIVDSELGVGSLIKYSADERNIMADNMNFME